LVLLDATNVTHCCCMGSWTGVMLLCSDHQGLKSLVEVLIGVVYFR
jgi:hypothetical protein